MPAHPPYPYPAIRVGEKDIRFNRLASPFFTKRFVSVETTGDIVIFKPTEIPTVVMIGVERHSGIRYIRNRFVSKHLGLRKHKGYKLYRYKDGYAVKLKEPLE